MEKQGLTGWEITYNAMIISNNQWVVKVEQKSRS